MSNLSDNPGGNKKLCSGLGIHDLIIEQKNSSRGTNTVRVNGEKFIDTEGGFLLAENLSKREIPPDLIFDDFSLDESTCLECKKTFLSSFLLKHFEYSVCDDCRDPKDKHSLITRTDAKAQYLLKDCDFDSRQPPLKFILKSNPHNVRWGQMKLYLHIQVEKRALEVWESYEKLEEAHEEREENRIKVKTKKYNKNLKALRMEVRSSLYNRTSGPTHVHVFGEEVYNEEEDNYSKTCLKCDFVETFEKM